MKSDAVSPPGQPPVAKRFRYRPPKPGRYWRFEGREILSAVSEAAERGQGVWFHLSGKTLTLQMLDKPSIDTEELKP